MKRTLKLLKNKSKCSEKQGESIKLILKFDGANSFELQIVPLTKRHDLSSFSCNNAELDDFLKNDALNAQEDIVSKTHLCIWHNSIVGYITLTTDTLEVYAVEERDGVEGYPHRKYPCIRIARLAVDRRFERKGFGTFLLLVATGIAMDISDKVGCRYITVDSKHNPFPKMYLNMYPILKRM